jgi:hypothetical protein
LLPPLFDAGVVFGLNFQLGGETPQIESPYPICWQRTLDPTRDFNVPCFASAPFVSSCTWTSLATAKSLSSTTISGSGERENDGFESKLSTWSWPSFGFPQKDSMAFVPLPTYASSISSSMLSSSSSSSISSPLSSSISVGIGSNSQSYVIPKELRKYHSLKYQYVALCLTSKSELMNVSISNRCLHASRRECAAYAQQDFQLLYPLSSYGHSTAVR